ncbi:T9SS type A sorting domain-containing protein [Lewinella sp. W8]|uniref:T9SS type A sorting domain-containing protein n=1 Tax=Lewinella sp. W8 TaxID=2528208 RepID=UPI0010688AD7|nr:T9SS type A sorting domain-containing protein [Lewinella sp. W8]MTB52839.1 T9SS type A sorting domain-containing protein [Lewinella sp. W8]
MKKLELFLFLALILFCGDAVQAQTFEYPRGCSGPNIFSNPPVFFAEINVDGAVAPDGLEVGLFDDTDGLVGRGTVNSGEVLFFVQGEQTGNGCPVFAPGETVTLKAVLPVGIRLAANSTFTGTLTNGVFDGPDGTTSQTDLFDFRTVTLPVTLLDFRAVTIDRKVELNWATSEEINNSHFEIERSANPTESFVNVGKVLGNGTSEALNTYRFVDPTAEEGINYYRLKQIDFDGTFEYSPIVVVELEEAPQRLLSVFPNPVEVNGRLTVRLQGGWAKGATTLTLFDAGGRRVGKWTELSNGSFNTELPALPAGLYQLVATDGTERLTTGVVVR